VKTENRLKDNKNKERKRSSLGISMEKCIKRTPCNVEQGPTCTDWVSQAFPAKNLIEEKPQLTSIVCTANLNADFDGDQWQVSFYHLGPEAILNGHYLMFGFT